MTLGNIQRFQYQAVSAVVVLAGLLQATISTAYIDQSIHGSSEFHKYVLQPSSSILVLTILNVGFQHLRSWDSHIHLLSCNFDIGRQSTWYVVFLERKHSLLWVLTSVITIYVPNTYYLWINFSDVNVCCYRKLYLTSVGFLAKTPPLGL